MRRSTVGESHCHGAKAISGKVVTTIALRASGITHSLGTMIVVKKGHNDLLPKTHGVILFQTKEDFELCASYDLGNQVK